MSSQPGTNPKIAWLLKHKMAEMKLTQRSFASKFSNPNGAYSNIPSWRMGRTGPGPKYIDEFCKILNVTPDDWRQPGSRVGSYYNNGVEVKMDISKSLNNYDIEINRSSDTGEWRIKLDITIPHSQWLSFSIDLATALEKIGKLPTSE